MVQDNETRKRKRVDKEENKGDRRREEKLTFQREYFLPLLQ